MTEELQSKIETKRAGKKFGGNPQNKRHFRKQSEDDVSDSILFPLLLAGIGGSLFLYATIAALFYIFHHG